MAFDETYERMLFYEYMDNSHMEILVPNLDAFRI